MNMEMDTNVDNYSTEDLLTILDLDDEPTEQDIIRTTNQFNDKYTDDGNDDLANFFIDVQNTFFLLSRFRWTMLYNYLSYLCFLLSDS